MANLFFLLFLQDKISALTRPEPQPKTAFAMLSNEFLVVRLSGFLLNSHDGSVQRLFSGMV
jgi:hypothetical protein